jgi:hypothetical protein
MDSLKVVFEHPLVTRAKQIKKHKDSPMVTSKDHHQPSQGYLFEKMTFQDYIEISTKSNNNL